MTIVKEHIIRSHTRQHNAQTIAAFEDDLEVGREALSHWVGVGPDKT